MPLQCAACFEVVYLVMSAVLLGVIDGEAEASTNAVRYPKPRSGHGTFVANQSGSTEHAIKRIPRRPIKRVRL
ncbi:hypothetical protein HDV64DRAFT_258465 [Trichoderma sp. TUCIM 5745]